MGVIWHNKPPSSGGSHKLLILGTIYLEETLVRGGGWCRTGFHMVTQPMPSLADFPAIVFHIWDNWQIYHVGPLRRTRYHMVTHATTCIHSCPIYTVRLSKYAWRPNTTQFKVQAVCLVLNTHHSFDQRKRLFQMPHKCICLYKR